MRPTRTSLLSAIALVLAACSASPAPAPVSQAQEPVTAPPASPPAQPSVQGSAVTFTPTTFTAQDGTKVEAERGTFEVPENRADPKSRKIKISFVRFKSTSANPGDPIVYLAGGPGGTATGAAQGPRFPLFMALREVSDVIALDQRGTGLSMTMQPCAVKPMPAATAMAAGEISMTRDVIVNLFRTEIARCFGEWEAQGVDIDGYTTLQNAHDLEDLRKALGARKLNLWGISYGSHLGLAMMKYHGGSVNKAVLSGIEGLDQTIKRPALTDKVLDHVQEIIDADPKAKALYPDLAGLMRRVHARLNANPAVGSFTPPNAPSPIKIKFDGFTVQLLASQTTADPSGLANLPLIYLALDNGQYDRVASMLYGPMIQQTSMFRGMPEAMDLASGASPARLKLVQEEAKTALLGEALNFPMPQIMGIRPGIDLGDEFRAPFKSDIPALFISATLDGRTYPDEAREEIKGFSNKTWLVVENGGHNIYEADKRIQDIVVAYFKGQPAPTTLSFKPPTIAKP